MTQWRPHVESAARLTLEQHIIATQMNLSRFTCSAELFQMAVAELPLFVFLITNGLSVHDSLGNRSCRCIARRVCRVGIRSGHAWISVQIWIAIAFPKS